ncbi:unnamed protein product [Auanema sp. JU1783]|nr:unnamed protein product [Auanema sp. JU1783]
MISSPELIQQEYATLLRLSCSKIVNSRHRRGGVNIHKNLLVLQVIKRVQDAKFRLEEMVQEELKARKADEDVISPPHEFTVTDCGDFCDESMDEPLEFGSMATEDEDIVPQPVPKDMDDALARLGERKRKFDDRSTPRHKTQRVADRAVPVLRLLNTSNVKNLK